MATTKNIIMKQFNGTDYDILYPKTIYNQVSGVAPAGYGLGSIGKRVTDMNNAQESGFYSALGASNLPPNVESVQYGSVLVLCSQADRVTQVYFQDVTDGTGTIAVRRLNGKGWSQWEFINPPMKLGVEYRTTERYLGKPVYAKAVSVGDLVANTLSVASMATGCDTMVRCYAVATQESNRITSQIQGAYYSAATLYADGIIYNGSAARVVVLGSLNFTNCVAVGYYTKSAD